MGLELVVTERHLECLQNTKPCERGYILAERVENELWTMRIMPGNPGFQLIAPSELRNVIVQVLTECQGYLPFIRPTTGFDRQIAEKHYLEEAFELNELDRLYGFNKLFGYVLIGKEPFFYGFEEFGDDKTGKITTVRRMPIQTLRRSA